MPAIYRHTQIGYWALFFTLPWIATFIFILIWGTPPPGMDILYGLVAIGFALLACFLYGMTITIDDTHICWHYGLGSFRKQVAIEDIVDVRIEKELSMGGLGSRHTSKGMQYAVTFGRGIELEVKTPWKKNKIIVLGSDEPEVLREVLMTKIRSRMKLLGAEIPEAILFNELPDPEPTKRTDSRTN
ncbi:MAG: hypothetical protein AAF564_05525 [Bacteroidota bacterium]